MEKKYQWLEVMRGLAAMWVLLHHAELTTKAFCGESTGSIFIARGLMGIDFFFILSGFIIAYSVSRMTESDRSINEYLLARFFRIYLPYLPIGIGMFAAYAIFPSVSGSDRDIGLLTSLTLLPTKETTALSVAWTLKHELIFYALFGFTFISRMIGAIVLSGWFAFVLVTFMTQTKYTSPLIEIIASPLNLWFFVGIFVFSMPTVSLRLGIWIMLIIGLSLALYCFTVLGFGRLYVGIVLSSMIYLLTKVSNIRMKPPTTFLFLGAASYSVYLFHSPIQSISARVLSHLGMTLGAGSYFVVVAICSLMASIVYYILVESPAVKWSKAFINKKFSRRVQRVKYAPK